MPENQTQQPINPYTSPSTPSNQITNSGEPLKTSDSTAYRHGDTFYCEPNFNPPPICFKSGNTKKSELEQINLNITPATVSLYLTQKQRGKINWEKFPIGQILSLAFLLLIIVTMFTSFFYLLVLNVFITAYGLKTQKNYGIKAQSYHSGFIQIHGAHPDFLKIFPQHDSPS